MILIQLAANKKILTGKNFLFFEQKKQELLVPRHLSRSLQQTYSALIYSKKKATRTMGKPGNSLSLAIKNQTVETKSFDKMEIPELVQQ